MTTSAVWSDFFRVEEKPEESEGAVSRLWEGSLEDLKR